MISAFKYSSLARTTGASEFFNEAKWIISAATDTVYKSLSKSLVSSYLANTKF